MAIRTYRRISPVVTVEDYDGETYPSVLLNAPFDVSIRVPGQDRQRTLARGEEGPYSQLTLYINGQAVQVKRGDLIARDDLGNVSVVSENELKAHYEDVTDG